MDGVDADDLSELEMTISSVGSSTRRDGRELADLGVRLHVDDAGAAAALEAVLIVVGALTEAVANDIVSLHHFRDKIRAFMRLYCEKIRESS